MVEADPSQPNDTAAPSSHSFMAYRSLNGHGPWLTGTNIDSDSWSPTGRNRASRPLPPSPPWAPFRPAGLAYGVPQHGVSQQYNMSVGSQAPSPFRLIPSNDPISLKALENTGLINAPGHEEQQPLAPPRKPASRRGVASDAEWERRKPTIENLYKTKNFTLAQTMAAMKDRGFHGSRTMYHEKLAAWGISKNLKKKVVRRIMDMVSDRSGQETEIIVGSQKVDLGRVQRRYQKHYPRGSERSPRPQDGASPAGIGTLIVRTPVLVEEDDTLRPAGPAPRLTAPAPNVSAWTPSAKTPSAAQEWQDSPLDETVLQLDSRGLSMVELLERRKAALSLINQGILRDGIDGLKTVLCGLRHKFNPRHEICLATSYVLADAYFQSCQDEKAFQVFDWISSCHCSSTGLWSPDSIRHYIHIVEMLQRFRQGGTARMLAFNVYQAIHEGWESESDKSISVPRLDEQDQEEKVCPSLDIGLVGRIIGHSSEPTAIEQQILLLDLWTRAGIPGIEAAIQIHLDELRSISLPHLDKLHLNGLCLLIRFHLDAGRHDDAQVECTAARTILAEAICARRRLASGSGVPIPRPWHLALAVQLASLHMDCGNHDRAQRVLEYTAGHLVAKKAREGTESDDGRLSALSSSAIRYFIAVALMLYKKPGLGEPRSWLERALSVATKAVGPFHVLSTHLRAALERLACPSRCNDFGFRDLSSALSDMIEAQGLEPELVTSIWKLLFAF